MLDQVKNDLNDPELDGWRLKEALEKYRNLLIRTGRDLQEYEQWLNEHADRMTVKEIRLKEARQRNYIDAEIRILEGLYEHETNCYAKHSRLKSLLKAYEAKKDTPHVKSTLTMLLTRYAGYDMEDIRRLRSMCTNEEWNDIREKIIENNPAIQLSIFHDEKLYDRLLKALADCPIETVDIYRAELQDLYPMELLEMYMRHLNMLGKRHACRPVYEEMQRYLHTAAGIPGGREPVRNLIYDWIDRFPTRRVMLEMMYEVLNTV